ncbi:Nicotinamide mononucleotide adenylyltransferase 1 [Melipona quadrifasciata]|uniref:Nicotinamide/nicotinic acid mononucleotide adenylyltransferase 3 n=1 Tax=Melipona quadrifasciata TaxID=166423 RepID=A0A0M9AAQ7_9HYME|nr:Nicotinamide mononucleotide adenylyltransferase 1 [Melipona quadrifasciata]
MLRTISQLTRVVALTQIWLKHQPECSLYSIVVCCGGSRNDLPRIITHQSKCSVSCLYKSAKREFQQSSKLAVITCSGTKEEKMAPTRVILMSCGSYNPPTNMHLRMFEIARDHLHRMGTHVVVGGVISPVHDAYAKKDLAAATHRCAMLRLALQNNDWIYLSTWETRQNGWTKTRITLQYHQNLLNSVLFDSNNVKHNVSIEDLEWIPENVRNSPDRTPIQIKLLCGADLLESFGIYDLWAEEDIDAIVGEHGLVVITREGSNPNKFIYDSDILSKYMHNIYIVTEWIPNEVSSTRIRRAFKRGESVRYLLQDAVIDYVYKQGIYDAKSTASTIIHIPRSCKLELTSPNANNYLTIDSKYQSTFLTPSPSDVTMESPSPIEIISIDVPDTVLRKNIQNATNVACVASRHVGSGGVGGGSGLEEAREKFISALLAENGNAKHITTAKAAYPGLAKQIIATETGESQILDEVGFVDDDRKVRKVVRVQPRSSQLEEVSPGVATSSKRENLVKVSTRPSIEAKDSVVKSSEASSRLRVVEHDVVDVGLGGGRIKDREARSSISSSTVSSMTISARDNGGGRHEGALSDFSVDKEDYRLTRYGLDDDTVEDEVQDERNDSRLDEQRLSDSIESQQESLLYKTQHTDRTGSDEVHDQDGFPSDSVRCSNTQVLVLVSAMIHNPFDKEGATLIVEENGVQGKGEIMIYKGESDGSIDKLSLLVQSPVPSSVSDESTVKIQEIVDDGTEIVRGDSDDSLAIDDKSSKRDVSLEIDGKYVKSVVNARKSPRKTKNGQMRVYGETDGRKVQESETTEKSVDSGTQSEETFYKTVSKSSKAASSRSKSPRKESKSRSKIHESTISDERTKKVKRYDAPLKGSLDSVINANDSRTVSRRRSKTEEMFSKKSKSYESIKKMPEVCYEDPSKADSTSQLITANELDMQTDEFCSVCCYANELSLRTEEVMGTEEAILRSNCSSIVDEDSTECDICSSWNLQESTDTLDRKLVSSATDCDQLCEVCEICNEICATFNPDQEPRSYSVREPRAFDFSSRSLPKDSSRIGDSIATDPSLDEDSFEIENCGFQSGPESMDDRKLGDQTIDKQLSLSFNISDSAVIKKKSRDKYFIPKDELAILASGGKRMNRKGSLFRKKPAEDSVNVSQDKRRYSSVDNLQLAKASSRGNEKRSADNVRHMDSSTDNLDSLVESLGREDETSDNMNWTDKPKVRDNETVKMILTKHGIKIISEKETAL